SGPEPSALAGRTSLRIKGARVRRSRRVFQLFDGHLTVGAFSNIKESSSTFAFTVPLLVPEHHLAPTPSAATANAHSSPSTQKGTCPKMHIFVSGGSGRNGRLVIQSALDRGHSVTTLARDPSSLTPHPRLTILKGTPTSQADVQAALVTPGPPAAIITTLNPRRTSENPFSPLSPDSPPDLLTSTARILLAAIADALPPESPPSTSSAGKKSPKIVANSSMGVGESWRAMSWPMRLVFRHSTMRITLQDHDRMDALVRNSGLPFVLARPARLLDGGARDVHILPDDGSGAVWNPTVTRASVARWLVDAAESTEWDGKSPVITN
ncbi:hypothetical protein TOPH_01287, partial [Tolypocladium ophioglossoides CBS 100239]